MSLNCVKMPLVLGDGLGFKLNRISETVESIIQLFQLKKTIPDTRRPPCHVYYEHQPQSRES